MIFDKAVKLLRKIAGFLMILGFFTPELLAKNTNKEYLDKNFSVNIRKNQDNLVAKFKDWSVYRTKRQNQTFCYILSMPIAKKGNNFKRASSYFVVNNLINDADEIMTVAGYYFKDNSDIEISFGTKKFYLLPYNSRGWAYSANDDLDIIKELQKNQEFSITAFSRKNKVTIDRYSLIGFKQAYFKLKEICKND